MLKKPNMSDPMTCALTPKGLKLQRLLWIIKEVAYQTILTVAIPFTVLFIAFMSVTLVLKGMTDNPVMLT